MSAVRTRVATQPQLGPDCNGILLSPAAFDRADFEDGWRYELVQGVLLVTDYPPAGERAANDELGHLLRNHQAAHPEGNVIDATIYEQTVRAGKNRRRVDRAIWVGLGRLPREHQTPTIVVEFVSQRNRDRERDFRTKRAEYLRAGVQEYWVIDRFLRKLTVFSGSARRREFGRKEAYKTDLLPGFELPLRRLLAIAEEWAAVYDEEDA